MKQCEDVGSWAGRPRAQTMKQSDEVEAMLHLHALGWGLKRIAREFGCSKNTVRRYVEANGWMAYSRPTRGGKLEDQEAWLKERFLRHRGNAEVVRQDLLREQSIDVSLRTVERAVLPFRRLLTAEAKATVRFETPPGRQLQVDFGQRRVPIAGERVRVFLFVATLGYSRRCYVATFRHERQSSWFRGLEGTFNHFGGVTREVLLDNPRPLVVNHDMSTREVEFNHRFLAFADYWGFRPRACAPYRARTKGKDERGVGYVKASAIAGHRFESWAGMDAHLGWWQREIADRRCHGTTGEVPLERFAREAERLRPCAGRPPFGQLRDLTRTVHADCAVVVDTNAYSVPWRLIGERVRVVVSGGRVRSPRPEGCRRARRARGTPRSGHRPGPLGRRRRRPTPGRDRGGPAEAGAAASARRVRGRRRGEVLMAVDHETLLGWLTRLQLTAIRDQLDNLLDEAAEKKLTLREALAMFVEREVSRKDERRIEMALKIARFPMVRELADFDFKAQPSVDRRQVRELATSRWVAHGDALLVLGPPGVGKTHLAVALGREAIRQSYSTLFTTAQALMAALVKAHSEGRLEDRLAFYAKPKLLIAD